MPLINTTDFYTKLNQISDSDNPRANLCDWLNVMSAAQIVFFLRYIAGWPTPENYGDRSWRLSGDRIFKQLCDELGIQDKA